MFRPKHTVPFLTLSALVAAGVCATATDEIPATSVSQSTTVLNLSGAENYKLSDGATLTANQVVDGSYSGTILGTGTLAKTGDGALNFSGKFDSFNGNVKISAGVMVFEDGASVSGHAIEISNSGVLVFNQSGNFDGKQISIEGKNGSVESTGAGTTTLGTSKGAELDVRAGKLVADGVFEFDKIRIAADAELCIGTGNANNGLVGNVEIASAGTLRFDRKSASDNPLIFNGSISGSGEIVLDNEAQIRFTGEKHTHTGAITLNAGTLFFMNEKQVEVASSKITLNGGTLGGNAKIAGSVDVLGRYSPASSSSPLLGGMLNLGIAGATLSVGGDLTFDPVELEIVTDKDGNQSWRIANYGGSAQVSLSELGCGKIEIAGKTTLGGTLILSAAEGIKPGQVRVFLDAKGGFEGAFEVVSVQSDNVMLVTEGVGGIRAGQLGVASIENRNLRKRAAFREHTGTKKFVNLIASWTAADAPNEVGQSVNLAMGDGIADSVNNFSPLAHSALVGMGVRQSNLEVDFLRRSFVPGMTPPASPDGISVPANMQYFATFLSEFVDHDDSIDSPIYDSSSFGVMAGAYSWIDEERIAGATVAVHRGSAQTHGYKKGTLEDNALRMRAFVGFMPKNSDWSLLFGVSAAGHYYDLNRETDTGTNRADEFGLEAGFFAAWSYRDALGDNWFFTPYARFDFNYVRVDTVRESGSASALEVDAFGYASYRLRFGSGVEKKILKEGGTEMVVGLDFGCVAELGRDSYISSNFKNFANSKTTVRGAAEDRFSFEFTPRLTYRLDAHWVVEAAYNLQFSVDNSSSAAFTLGVRTTF